MCGRFSLGATAATLAAQFHLVEAPAWTPGYNIAPTREVRIARQSQLSPAMGRPVPHCALGRDE
jgi:putative SOS response-associated peptidase YedK